MVATSIAKNVEEDTQRAAAEVQLQKYGQFFEEYSRCLSTIERKLYKSYVNSTPIMLDTNPKEDAMPSDIINCDNKVISKILTTFSVLCSEVSFLQHEAGSKYIDIVLYYGEGIPDNAPYEECQLVLSKVLPQLQEILDYVRYAEKIIVEILSQLSAFYNLNLEICHFNMYQVFESLAELLLTLLLLQEITANNNTLLYHWSLYKRTIQLALHRASEFNYEIQKINLLEKLVTKLENQLLTRNIFGNLFSLQYDKKISVKKNKKLSEEFDNYLRNTLSYVEKKCQIGTREYCTKWMKVCTMFAFSVNLFSTYDSKIFSRILENMKKCPLVTLQGNVVTHIDKFLINHIGSLLKRKELRNLEKDNDGQQILLNMTQKINSDSQHYAMRVLHWVVKMEEKLKPEEMILRTDYMNEVIGLMFEGISYASSLKTALCTISALYIDLGKPMSKMSAVSFCRLAEILRCIASTYQRRKMTICKLTNYAIQYAQYECSNIVSNIKNDLTKNFKEGRIDIVSSLVITEDTLNGPATDLRLIITKLCLSLAGQMQTLLEPNTVPKILDKITFISNMAQVIDSITDCSFIYWNKDTLLAYFEQLRNKKQDITHAACLLDTLFEHYKKFNVLDKVVDTNICEKSKQEILAQFVTQLIEPLGQKIEENVRIQVLQHLQVDPRTLHNQHFELTNTYNMRSLCVGEKCIDTRHIVETYLNKVFYDLTTVALHNKQLYNEMKTLANQKFKLRTLDDNLPSHSLEQGLDLLEVTRNIHVFVIHYFYNLNNQIFIEISSNSKHLNTINIRHIANSIRAHGFGIMNTVINYTYQFLKQKLNILSQFLYDEQIKSRLLKEITVLNEQDHKKYSFDRAERFNRAMQKLRTSPDGLGYLDQLRHLVTQIGNALGYVRMIRTGGLHCCSDSMEFIQNLENISFEEMCHRENFSETTVKAASTFDNVINDLFHNVTISANYFKILVDVFSSVITDQRYSHLKNFYIIVPALTINFVEYLITAKESMVKKNQTNASFTDDGFAMGITYILQVLNLCGDFESLQWFKSVKERNKHMVQKLTKQTSTMSRDDKTLQHTLNLSLKHLQVYENEFDLLYYNLYSAKVLFTPRNYDNDDNN